MNPNPEQQKRIDDYAGMIREKRLTYFTAESLDEARRYLAAASSLKKFYYDDSSLDSIANRLWPIDGVGTEESESRAYRNRLVVFGRAGLPVPNYLRLKEWEGYSVTYRGEVQ